MIGDRSQNKVQDTSSSEGDDSAVLYTAEELRSFLGNLSDRDSHKLLLAARHFSKSGMAPEDLLHEAFARVLEGTRKARRDISFLQFIFGTMKSIASNEAASRSRLIFLSAIPDVVETTWLAAVPEPEGAIDSKIKLAAVEQRLNHLFKKRPLLQKLFEARMRGLNGPQAQKFAGLSDRQFKSNDRTLRRLLKKMQEES